MGAVLKYREALTEAMTLLARDPRTLFVGQSMRYSAQAMWPTFTDVPMERRIEMPVTEDFQMGYCTGLALAGFVPVCVYSRWDFLLIAANQLVNHLDKIYEMSDFSPHVIIRVAVGTTQPLNTGPQHTQDHSGAFRLMLDAVKVVTLREPAAVVPAYSEALHRGGATILVEYMDDYQK